MSNHTFSKVVGPWVPTGLDHTADVVFSVADFSLSSVDSRSTIDGSQLTLALSSPLACHQQTRQFSADACAVFSVGGVHRSSTSSRVRTSRCPFLFLLQAATSLCNLSSLSNAVVITVNANQALNRMPIERIRIDTCADDGMPTGRSYDWNARVWTSRLSGAHYGPETATSPEICRLLLAKLWLRSN